MEGSPPHGRGKAGLTYFFSVKYRITPAWAGKSSQKQFFVRVAEDHPRMGGEKSPAITLLAQNWGSPPHGRGKGQVRSCKYWRRGITPAWAGKSLSMAQPVQAGKDHPRMGGEKRTSTGGIDFPMGSPPHGRGKGHAQRGRKLFEGITPAWAGKRLKRSHRSGIFISGPIPFHSVLHRPAGSGGSRAGRDGSPAGQPQNAGPA